MSDQHLHLALKSLIEISETKYTIKDIVGMFKTSNTNKCESIFKELLGSNEMATKVFHDFFANGHQKLHYDCLKVFLKNYVQNEEINSNLSSRRSRIDNDSTSSPIDKSADDQNKSSSVLDIKKRVTEAASIGISQSAQTSTLLANTNKSRQSFSTTLKAPEKYAEDMNRNNLWLFHLPNENYNFNQNQIIGTPISCQEKFIIKELLYCLIGIRCTYILPIANNNEFQTLKFEISNEINASMQDVIEKILPLANHYYLIKKFTLHIRSHSCGQVLQAMGGALNLLLNHYYSELVKLQLKLDTINLYQLLYILTPVMERMEVITNILLEIWQSNLTGDKVLSLLYEKCTSLTGHNVQQQLIIMLTEFAAEPYMEILKLWMLKGIIVKGETSREFLIEENHNYSPENNLINEQYTDVYWEKRYTLRKNNIPNFFFVNDADLILRTGKYLNVIQECGINIGNKFIENDLTDCNQFHFSPMKTSHLLFVQQTHKYASETLLNVVMKEKDLMGHLMAVRRYFLMQQGDIVHQFMDNSEHELSRHVNETRPTVLETLLGLTLRTSSAKHDPYLNNLHIEIFSYELCEQMVRIQSFGMTDDDNSLSPEKKLDVSAVECFGFKYHVDWPVSLVLNHHALAQYQMMFRLLFYIKHVERQLCKVWLTNKNLFKISFKYVNEYQHIFSLRQRMLYVIQNLQAYMTIEVIEPYWHKFIENLKIVANFDELLKLHTDFVHSFMNDCLLENSLMLHYIISLCNVSLKFCKYIIDAENLEPSNRYFQRIDDYDDTFSKLMRNIIQELTRMTSQNESNLVINLAHRIDFNANGIHVNIDNLETSSNSKIMNLKQR